MTGRKPPHMVRVNRMKLLRSARQGFSLIELKISMLIVMIIIIATISLFIGSWRSSIIGNTYLDVYSNSRVAVEYMSRDIRWAVQVLSSYGGYTTSNSCLVLMVPSIDASGNIKPSYYDYIIYQLQGSDLRRILQADAQSSRVSENRIIAHYCSSLALSGAITGDETPTPLSDVQNLSTINLVAISLPLNKPMLSLTGGGTGGAQLTPTTEVRLRNK